MNPESGTQLTMKMEYSIICITAGTEPIVHHSLRHKRALRCCSGTHNRRRGQNDYESFAEPLLLRTKRSYLLHPKMVKYGPPHMRNRHSLHPVSHPCWTNVAWKLTVYTFPTPRRNDNLGNNSIAWRRLN